MAEAAPQEKIVTRVLKTFMVGAFPRDDLRYANVEV